MPNKKRYIVNHIYPPTIFAVNGQRYIFPGWIPVEDDVTLDDVEHISPYASLRKETFTVTGSSGNTYTVTRRENTYTCDCPAGKFRGQCKHINSIKKQELA